MFRSGEARTIWYCTFGSRPRPARARIIARAILLRAADHFRSIWIRSLTEGIFRRRNPTSNIPKKNREKCLNDYIWRELRYTSRRSSEKWTHFVTGKAMLLPPPPMQKKTLERSQDGLWVSSQNKVTVSWLITLPGVVPVEMFMIWRRREVQDRCKGSIMIWRVPRPGLSNYGGMPRLA